MSFVLDASFVMAWVLEEEEGAQFEAFYERLSDEGAYVPQLWHFETRNTLLSGERRVRISSDQVANAIVVLNELAITTDTEPDLDAALALARMHRLTFYDALYLELARRREAILVTLDGALLRAADATGVSTS